MFKIFVLTAAYGKMLRMLDLMDKEIGALMIGRIHEGDAYVEDVIITKQNVTGASVDFKEEGIDLATMQACMQGKVVIGWFHSHVNMSAFWSGTDMATINKLIAHTEDYLVSIVSNKRYEHVGRIDYYAQSTFGVERQFVDKIPVIPMLGDFSEYDAEIKAAISEQVHETSITYSKGKARKGKVGQTDFGDVFDERGNYIGYKERRAQIDKIIMDYNSRGEGKMTPEQESDYEDEIAAEYAEYLMEQEAARKEDMDDIEEQLGDEEIEKLVKKGMSYEQASALVYGV